MKAHFNMKKLIMKINIYLALNPLIKLIIELTLLFLLSSMFQTTILTSKNAIVIEADIAYGMKTLILEKLIEYVNMKETKEYFGTVNTELGLITYPLITQHYHEIMQNPINIKNFLETVNWHNYLEKYNNDLSIIIKNIFSAYCEECEKQEKSYISLLSQKNLEECRINIKNILLEYVHTVFVTNTNIRQVLMSSDNIEKYLDNIDIIKYVESWDFHSNNMALLKHKYVKPMSHWYCRIIISLNHLLDKSNTNYPIEFMLQNDYNSSILIENLSNTKEKSNIILRDSKRVIDYLSSISITNGIFASSSKEKISGILNYFAITSFILYIQFTPIMSSLVIYADDFIITPGAVFIMEREKMSFNLLSSKRIGQIILGYIKLFYHN